MNSLELGWLIPVAVEVLGLAIALVVFGFAYEESVNENTSLIKTLEGGQREKWLAVGGILFSVGLCFTGASWAVKVVSITLVVLVSWMAWSVPKEEMSNRTNVIEESVSRHTAKQWAARIFIAAVLVLVAGWAIFIGWHAVHLAAIAREVQGNISQNKMEKVIPLVDPAAKDIKAIRQGLSPVFPIFNLFEGLPVVGVYLGQIEPVMNFADGLAQAGKEVMAGLAPLLDSSQNSQADQTFLEQFYQVAETDKEHLKLAVVAISQASEAHRKIRPELMPESIRSEYQLLDSKFNLIEAGVRLLPSAPMLLGGEGAQNYLILAQNRDEIRPTGGFISGIGLLKMEDGKILELSIGDSYKIDDFSKPYPKPPEALHDLMLADYWVTRDANWSPDFPTSAQEAQNLYTISTGIQTNGVIAFNQLVIQRILEVVGPVNIPGESEAITSQNIDGFMQQAWAPASEQGLTEEWWNHRKDFMQALGVVIIQKVMTTGDNRQLLSLAKTVVDLLDQGQLLLFVNDSESEGAINIANWSGGLNTSGTDYLYMVDSNVGFNKVDSVIHRSLTYQLDLTDLNEPKGIVTVTYSHTGNGNQPCIQDSDYGTGKYQDMVQRCYLDYWRIYTLNGTHLVDSKTLPIPADELLNGLGWPGIVESQKGEANTQVYSGLLMLPIGQSVQAQVTYSLPKSIFKQIDDNRVEYTLHIDKQPGIDRLPLTIEIRIPDNYSVSNAVDGWTQLNNSTLLWQEAIDKGFSVDLVFRRNR